MFAGRGRLDGTRKRVYENTDYGFRFCLMNCRQSWAVISPCQPATQFSTESSVIRNEMIGAT
jgi:hypothetical protein